MKKKTDQQIINVIDPTPLSSAMRERISRAQISGPVRINPFDESWFSQRSKTV
jgi:hypothetical protein